MPILQNGQFTFTIPSQDLAKGLRPSKRSPRNVKYLVECEGAIGLDGVLQVIEELDTKLIDPTDLGAVSFPYPQLFVFSKHTIVCTKTEIFEYIGGALVSVLSGITAGSEWSGVDFQDFIYMSNGSVTVVRRAESGTWEVTTDYPSAGAMANFNGQIMLGCLEE